MRRKEKQIKEFADIEAVLESARVCRIAMVDKDFPYIVPINFGYKDGALFLHSAPEGRKIDLIKNNPKVCFEVDELISLKKAKLACEWGAQYKSVIGTGIAGFIDDAAQKKKALDIIMSQYSGRSFEYSEETLAKTAIIKIDIEEMAGKQA